MLVARFMPACVDDAAPAPAPRVPYAPGAPWPKFRGNAAQDALSTVRPTATDGALWTFRTGKGVFSSPIVGADETVYVGSADRNFYALRPDGTERWHFATGEIIDSSGLLDDRGRVYVGSGDGHLYSLDAATGARGWTFEAEDPMDTRAFIRWFEGNVAMGPSGDLFVPNDNFRIYRIDRTTGTRVWSFATRDQTWSLPAIDAATGELFVGNNNLLTLLGPNTFAISAAGRELWHQATNGTIAASPMLTPDGLVVVGGFDGYVRAYDRADGTLRWQFGAHDHIYASPARLPDGTVIQPAADGTVYALNPRDGTLRWAYDTREAIRSSPAVDADGNVYVGGGDGRLYVIRADGTLRWSMQLITDERHNLNASPALGRRGVYIGGESGEVFGVPYDYCLRAPGLTDPRCDRGPGENLPRDGVTLAFTTPTGVPLAAPPSEVDPHGAMAFSLFVRADGDTRLALIDTQSLRVDVAPAAEVDVRVSGDRRFFTVTPRTRLTGDALGHVRLTVSGNYLVDPMREGLRFTGGTLGGSLAAAFDFTLRPDRAGPLPLPVPSAPGDPSGVWELYRLAAPLPTILPSYNQIGFDSLHYLVGLVEGDAAHAVGWLDGAMLTADGQTVIDPATRAVFPVEITDQGGFVTVSNQNSLSLDVMNFRLPFETFRLTARVDAQGNTLATPTLSVTTVCGNIMLYGQFLRTLGFCNPDDDRLTAFGAALLRPHRGGTQSAPVGVGAVTFTADAMGVTAAVQGSTVRVAEHAIGLLAIDATTGRPVSLDYGPQTTATADAQGALREVRVLFQGRVVPRSLRVYLMVDTYPAARGAVTLP